MTDEGQKTTSMAMEKNGGEDNDKDNTVTAEKKKRPGRPKKGVKTSPTKIGPDDQPEMYCPCGLYISKEVSVECDSCKRFWHLCCVGLKGLTDEMVKSLDRWDCPDCFVCLYSSRVTTAIAGTTPGSSSGECGTMRVVLKEELHLIQPVIRATVADAVRRSIHGSVCSKDDVENVVKSYADATKESQKMVLEESTKANSSQIVVEKVVRKLDSDKIEREKRKANIVVMKVPESKMASSGQKLADDKKFCYEELGMAEEDIESCWRAGKLDTSKPDYCRPLVIKLKDDETADEWTRNGRGFKTESGYWVNRDLCDADRKANFQAREERRGRMKSRTSEQQSQ